MNKKSGFTLLELIVITAVIAILSGIVASSIQKVRENRAAAQYVTAVNEIENSLKIWLTDSGIAWPLAENDGVTLEELLANDNDGLQYYLPTGTVTYNGHEWYFKNTGDDFDPEHQANAPQCTQGISLYISNEVFNEKVAQKVENMIDAGAYESRACGRFYNDSRRNNNNYYYHLAPSTSSFDFHNN